MDYESAVLDFLVANGNTFVSPQYSVETSWSCPDFLAIRPSKKECFVVEVSSGWNLQKLVEKVRTRDNQWFSKLRLHLEKLEICDEEWSLHALVFVRSERIEWFEAAIQQANDVHVWPLEITLTSWAWPDEVRSPNFSFISDKAKIVTAR